MNDVLIKLLETIVTGVLSVLGAYATVYFSKLVAKIKVETQDIKDSATRNLVYDALDTLQTLVTNEVTNAEVTLKAEVIKVSADGKITKEDGEQLKKTVTENIFKQIKDDTLVVLTSKIDDLDAYVDSLIETNLAKIKGQIK